MLSVFLKRQIQSIISDKNTRCSTDFQLRADVLFSTRFVTLSVTPFGRTARCRGVINQTNYGRGRGSVIGTIKKEITASRYNLVLRLNLIFARRGGGAKSRRVIPGAPICP